MPQLEIYREQVGKYKEVTQPFNYMPDDVLYRLPWLAGEPEPPLRVLYPLLMNVEGREIVDPLTIYIGWTKGKKPFAYNPRYIVNPLVLVVGTPGAGKSATLMTFIYNLMRNEVFLERGQRTPPVVIVDPEGEYAIFKQLIDPTDVLHLTLGRKDYINIFDRPSKAINPFVWYMRMLAVLQKFLRISPAQAALAYRVLKKAILELAQKEKGFTQDPATWRKDDITLEDIHNWLETTMNSLESQSKMTHSERRLYQGCSTLYSRLDQWMYPPNDAFSRKSTVNLSKIFNYKVVVLDARGLAPELFGLFTYWITYWIYGLMLERGPLPTFGIRVVLVIDEAWALLRKERREEENPLEALARRGRKYGILIVVATQTPEDVDEKMFSLFGTLVTGIIPSDKMVNKIVESRGMPKRFKSVIMSLGQGTLVWSINWRRKDFPMSRVPIIVHTDYPIKERIQVIID